MALAALAPLCRREPLRAARAHRRRGEWRRAETHGPPPVHAPLPPPRLALSVRATPAAVPPQTRMLVFAAITAIADAVLRRVACDVPSALSLHYSGEADGPAGPFALEMHHFEVESERAQLPSPHLAAARTMLLDYFRSCSSAVPPERHLFRFERSMELGAGERALLSQLCCQLAFPREEAQVRARALARGRPREATRALHNWMRVAPCPLSRCAVCARSSASISRARTRRSSSCTPSWRPFVIYPTSPRR